MGNCQQTQKVLKECIYNFSKRQLRFIERSSDAAELTSVNTCNQSLKWKMGLVSLCVQVCLLVLTNAVFKTGFVSYYGSQSTKPAFTNTSQLTLHTRQLSHMSQLWGTNDSDYSSANIDHYGKSLSLLTGLKPHTPESCAQRTELTRWMITFYHLKKVWKTIQCNKNVIYTYMAFLHYLCIISSCDLALGLEILLKTIYFLKMCYMRKENSE